MAAPASAQSLVEARNDAQNLFGLSVFETIDALTAACDAGEAKACERAAEVRAGEHVTAKKALSSLRAACRSGDGLSCLAQGLWTRHGIVGKPDPDEAAELFAQSCASGFAPGCYFNVLASASPARGAAVRSQMQALCDAGLDAGCMGTTYALGARELSDVGAASSALDPFLAACERRAGVCDFGHVIGALDDAGAKAGADYLARNAGANARRGIERELLERTKHAAQHGREAPEVVAALTAFQAAGKPLDASALSEVAARTPDVLAALLASGGGEVGTEQLRLALLHAAKAGNADSVRRLLEQGASPDVRSNGEPGWTALQVAIIENHDAVVDALLAGGADPRFANDAGSDALMSAAKRNRLGAMRALLDAGADVSARSSGNNGVSALHFAAVAGHGDAIELLARAGADLDMADRDGTLPLHYAINEGHHDAAKRLVEYGADVDVPFPNSGRTLLARAVSQGDAALTDWLLASGANPNIADPKGETPLFAAIRAENDALAETLLDAGADPRHTSLAGVTPSQLYAELAQQRAAAEAERQRQARLAEERRRRAEQERLAQKKKSNGFLGAIVGIAAGAAIGAEMGLEAEQLGQFASTMGEIGMAAEKGTPESFQQAQRSVNSLEQRLAATAPSTLSALGGSGMAGGGASTPPQVDPAEEYARRMRELARQSGDPIAMAMTDSALEAGERLGQALVDQREFENELARRQAELAAAQAAVREAEARQRAAASAVSAGNAPMSAQQRQAMRRQQRAGGGSGRQPHKQMTLNFTMPELRNCMIETGDDPFYVKQHGDCAPGAGNGNGSGPNAGGGPGDQFAANGSGNGGGAGPGGGQSPSGDGASGGEGSGLNHLEGKAKTVIRGSYPPLTWEEHAGLQKRNGCYRPAAGCVVLVEIAYDSASGRMRFKFRNDCSGVVHYRYSMPTRTGTTEGSWHLNPGRTVWVESTPGREVPWHRDLVKFYGARSSTGALCTNEIFRTDVAGIASAKRTRR
ncbi:ankyrin repeat domain-containing protein [Sphingomicrobium astaxanthinifaciens]|nr:ankyrin repeat domain-containing protein [Sphingomicrobium astaxanthinifaciens]